MRGEKTHPAVRDLYIKGSQILFCCNCYIIHKLRRVRVLLKSSVCRVTKICEICPKNIKIVMLVEIRY